MIKEATASLEVVKKRENGGEAQSLKLSGWGDDRLISRLKLSGGEEAVRRLLLAGELDAVGDKVLEISGFGVDIDDLKTDRLRRHDDAAVPFVDTASSAPRGILVAPQRRASAA